MRNYFNKQTVAQFYSRVLKVDLNALTDEQIENLEAAVKNWTYFFNHQTHGMLSKMTFTAERMIVSNGVYGPKTWEEKLYFYIRMVDPNFLFLEANECGNTMDEIKALCRLNFGIYDPYLIQFEKALYKRLGYTEDLWCRDQLPSKNTGLK